MYDLPPVTGAILISNPRTPMARSLQNPSPNTVRRVAQYAKAQNLSIGKALDHAGFAKGTPLKKRGSASSTQWFKKFFRVGQKGMGAKIRSGKFGAKGSRGGKVSAKEMKRVRDEYAKRFGRKIGRAASTKARLTRMAPEKALRARLTTRARAAWRSSKQSGKFSNSASAKKIREASASQLKTMAKKSGIDILHQHEKSQAKKAKLKAHAEKLRMQGKLRAFPPGRSGSKKSSKKSRRKLSPAQIAAGFGGKRRMQGSPRKRSVVESWAKNNGLALENGLALKNGLALENGLALRNTAITMPTFGGVASYLQGYAAPLAVGGVAGGAAHAILSAKGVTTKIADQVDRVPVVGPWVAENAPYTTQGLLAAVALGAVAPFVGGGFLTRLLAVTGGSALVFGAGMDAFNFVTAKQLGTEGLDLEVLEEEELLAGLALENVSALGGLALDNVSALGGLALENGHYGDGMAYELAPLQGSNQDYGAIDYGQASMADAYHAPADFDIHEGQALLNGRDHYLGTYGLPPRRHTQVKGTASHLAARPGHRWGWLIKTVGWEKARQICALPPQRRVRVIKKLKEGACLSYDQMMLEEQARQAEAATSQPELVPAAGVAPHGAMGASNYLGDPALFQGA